jgi:type III secretion protein L
MVFIHRADQELSRPDAEGKVIKAQDFWTCRKAREAMAEGVARRDQIIGAALSAFEAEQQRGYREGREAARLEQTANMIEIIGQTVDYFAKVEAQMVDLVMDAVRRIANDFDDREKVIKVVRNSLALVRNQKHITVKVHPSRIDDLKGNIHRLQEAYPGIENIEAIAEPGIADDACVIESDIGQVEASMSGQIEALRTTFERVFGSSQMDAKSSRGEQVASAAVIGTNQQIATPNAEFSGA